MKEIEKWFSQLGWTPLPFQQEAWEAYNQSKSGLISVPTGAGKTYAAYLAALMEVYHRQKRNKIQILYVTPLRALARDLGHALRKPIEDLKLSLSVEIRTGDTSASRKKKQLENPAEVLLTTPESLSILLCDPLAPSRLNDLVAVIIDEWHELLGTKRGVLLELSLARLKRWNPAVKIWGLTATLGNLKQAAQACVGVDRDPLIISPPLSREIILDTLLPARFEQLPWAGQLGLRMVPYVLTALHPSHSCLIFTNTRAQAERWYQALLEARPQWTKWIALHHGSLDLEERERIELNVKEGRLRFIVCTSSLDLGVDFSPVDQIIQIGSPKSIARLMQRAGRASHQPLAPCRIQLVPTHALELVEIQAFRQALKASVIEKRVPLQNCFDVLIQHLMTSAVGGGFFFDVIFKEIKTTYAYQDFSPEKFQTCVQVLKEGGKSLQAYPEYRKLMVSEKGYIVEDKKLILRHKMNIGTIASAPQVTVKFAKGPKLGAIDEKFVSELQPQQLFLFGGKILQLVQYRDLTAYVRLAKGKPTISTVWQGSRLPYSFALSQQIRKCFSQNLEESPEKPFLNSIFHLQNQLSHLPAEDEVLIEIFKSQEGWHLFLYPFEGRNIHEGLASLIASRLSQQQKGTFTLSANDYGFEILSRLPFNEELIRDELFEAQGWQEEMMNISNLHELSKGYFRDIARISGLVFQDFPGFRKNHRQLQMTTGLLYEIFRQYDPTHPLFIQAQEEMMKEKFEADRMSLLLHRLTHAKKIIKHLKKLSPFALPLYIERISSRFTNETLSERIERIQKSWTRT